MKSSGSEENSFGCPNAASGAMPFEVALNCATKAGEILLSRINTPKQIVHKGRADITTDVDTLVESQIVSYLRKEFPDFGILAEESHRLEGESEFTWIVDPLDGTRNYASGVPHFGIVIALAKKDEVILGITYDPVRKEVFAARKETGATLNGHSISVSDNKAMKDCIIGFDMGYSDEMALKAIKLIGDIWPGMQAIRVMGSAALGLAYVACGRIDIYFHHHLFPWDLASGLLLVKEAGGIVTDRDGLEASISKMNVIATNQVLHREFSDAIKGSEWQKS